jgi:hypothetical protein
MDRVRGSSLSPDQPGAAHQRIADRGGPSVDREALRRTVRSHVKWGRDCGSAAIVAGATVGFSLLMSGGPIRRDVYVSLLGAYGLLLLFAAYWWARAMHAAGQAGVSNVLNAVGPPALVVVIALSNLPGGGWPIKAYTAHWWEVVALAFFIVVTGASRRRNAEDALDQIEELGASRTPSASIN